MGQWWEHLYNRVVPGSRLSTKVVGPVRSMGYLDYGKAIGFAREAKGLNCGQPIVFIRVFLKYS